MLVVLVRFTIESGAEERFTTRVRQQAADSLSREPACRRFDVCVDPADRSRVLLYEVYETAASFEEHLKTAHFLAFDAETRQDVREKIVERWELLDDVRA